MKKNFTRDKTSIKLDLPINQVWSLLNSLDFWLDQLPPKVNQLSLDAGLKAGSRGQLIYNQQNYYFNILSWEKHRLISIKVGQDNQAMFLLQLDLIGGKQTTTLNLHLFNYTHHWWHVVMPRMTVRRWWLQFIERLYQALKAVEPELSTHSSQAQVSLPQGFKLWWFSNKYTRELKQVLKPFSLTPTQWYLLKAVTDLSRQDQQLTHEDIATNLQLHPMVVSDGVRALVKQNLVRKMKPPDNKRAFYLKPSPIGKQLIEASLPLITRFEQRFFQQHQEQIGSLSLPSL